MVGPGGVTEVADKVLVVVFVVVVDNAGAEEVEMEADTPTQYASSTQKLVSQSAETAGFQRWNSALVMPNFSSTVAQLSVSVSRARRAASVSRHSGALKQI